MINNYIIRVFNLFILLKKYISIFGIKFTGPFFFRISIKIFPNWSHIYLTKFLWPFYSNDLHIKNIQLQKNIIYRITFADDINKRSSLKKDILLSAKMIFKRKFKFLGLKKVDFTNENYWNKDFSTGFSWGKKFYTHYNESDIFVDNGSDIKIPWELCRMHHFTALGQAWKLTNDISYPEKICSDWKDWINENPFCYGINWLSTMEVAIRAVNFIVASELIYDSKLWKDNKDYFLNNIRLHGIYIENNLEIGVSNLSIIAGNHYLANICGLYIIAKACPNFPESKKWAELGKAELEKEISRTVLNDGFYFESSTSYHRFAIELFIYPYLVARNSGDSFSTNYSKKIISMLNFSKNIMDPSGTTPQIGDNDNGRLLILSNYSNANYNDYRYLLSMGAIIFNEPKFFKFVKNSSSEIFWLFRNKLNVPKNKKRLNIEESYSFDESGLRVINSRESNDYLLIRAHGPTSKSLTAHCHNDQLSFELWLDRKAIIVDNGTGWYTKSLSLRNKFRSTKMHNTVIINNKEINSIDKAKYFSLFSNSFSKILSHKIKPKYDEIFCIRKDDYKGEAESAHYRSFTYIKNDKLIINDKIISNGKFNASSYLHFHPLLNPELVYDNNNYFIKGIKNLIIKIIDESKSFKSIKINSSLFSKSYGIIEKSKKLKIDIAGFNEAKIKISFIHEN